MANGLVVGSGVGKREWVEDAKWIADDGSTVQFQISKSTGNVVVAGTLTYNAVVNLGGAVNLGYNFAINTNKFTVAYASGNTLVGGTLAVTGTSVFTGAVTASAGLTATTGGLTASAGNIVATLGNISAPASGASIRFDGVTVTMSGDTVVFTKGAKTNVLTLS